MSEICEFRGSEECPQNTKVNCHLCGEYIGTLQFHCIIEKECYGNNSEHRTAHHYACPGGMVAGNPSTSQFYCVNCEEMHIV